MSKILTLVILLASFPAAAQGCFDQMSGQAVPCLTQNQQDGRNLQIIAGTLGQLSDQMNQNTHSGIYVVAPQPLAPSTTFCMPINGGLSCRGVQ
jgi:hypothetical protein